MRRIVIALLFAASLSNASAQEVTGLAGWDIFIDPGHSQNENVGVFGYAEARKTLEVGLALRDLLLNTTDIDTVWISRTNHTQQVGLSQRSDLANSLGASWFHSIHSDAGAPSANTTVLLWGQYLNGNEKVPNGGKAMSDIMVQTLSNAMRIGTRGSIGDCSFYRSFIPTACSSGGPYLSVNRRTVMPSELSEAGFHTNPTQNQRNMNADWKRLEAQALYWAILDFHDVERPDVGILTGIVSNIETGQPINGATIAVLDTLYVTDTYESLFHLYSDDPDELHNGFYYLDGLEPGAALDVTVAADGFATQVIPVTLDDTFFTFLDVELIPQIPPTIVSSAPDSGEAAFRHVDPINIEFSRPMDEASVEAAFSIDPETDGIFTWTSGSTRMIFRPDTLLAETEYTVRIEDSAVGVYGDVFDGDADGEAGGDFVLTFTTGPTDVDAPTIVDGYPIPRQRGIPVRTVITYTFDEPLESATVIDARFELAPSSGGPSLPGTLVHDIIGERSVISFFPDDPLEAGLSYTFEIQPGLTDIFGNAIEDPRSFQFETSTASYEFIGIDSFEPTSAGVWWEPQQSGSTTGIVTDSTSFGRDTTRAVLSIGSTEAQRLTYGWDLASEAPLIRAVLNGGDPTRNLNFDAAGILQIYVYGDGSGTQFRFAVDDQGGHEVSPWYTVDWYGWRLVEWDLSEGETGTWLGDGTLNGPLSMDSFQFTAGEDGVQFGALWLDELRLARVSDGTPIAEEPALPGKFVLYPNYPNPFNPTTTIRFSLPAPETATLIVYNALGQQVDVLLRNEMLDADTHELTWDAGHLPSGVYFARLTTASHQASRMLILAK